MSSDTIPLDVPAGAKHPRRAAGRRGQVLGLALVIALLALLGYNLTSIGGSSAGPHKMPQNAAMEDKLGIRFSQVAVVGDGGLVTVTYVVLDSEKASKFQNDVAHPPILKSEARKGSAGRVSLMKQGHTLRAGQKYYLVYQNPADLVRHNEKIEIDYGQLSLKHVPVW
ncbi:MAG: hypothetical protein QOI76_1443 [Frankiales bacterium]|jgi:hypothetical protein|nr:hypothetical protein [Frankiales bacterium]MDX6257355.1 hypothetical protein [Frankiales bacterium]